MAGKNELVDYILVASDVGILKSRRGKGIELSFDEVDAVVTGVFEAIKEITSAGELVQIRGFGTFRLAELKERVMKNAFTKETYKVGPRQRIKFKPVK